MPRLRDQLEAERRTMNDEVRRAYEAMVAELRRTDFVARALGVGERFPDLVPPNAAGALVSLNRLLADGPLVVTFFRGEWCPYCRLMLDGLAAALPEIRALEASLVAITPETGGRALTARRNHNADFEVLCDIDCGVGLLARLPVLTPRADPFVVFGWRDD
jgi:thiol-disulfide isomerase/thioredoxin